MKRLLSKILLSGCVLLAMTEALLAQPVPDLPAPDPGNVLAPPIRIPDLQRAIPQVREELNLPDGSARVLDVQISSVRIVGATVVDEQSIARLFEPLFNRDVTANDLRMALDRVNALYLDAGYALGRAFVPTQAVRDGTLLVQVVEGYIGRIQTNTVNERTRLLIERFGNRILQDRPLRTETLSRYLLLIEDVPGLTLNAQLQGMNVNTGAATLVLRAEHKTVEGSFLVDNRADIDGIPFQLYFTGAANNLLGVGDRFALTTLLSPKPKEAYFYQGAYSAFLGTSGLQGTVNLSTARVPMRDVSFTGEVISTRTRASGELEYPFIRSAEQNLTFLAGTYYTRAAYAYQKLEFSRDSILAGYAGMKYATRYEDKIDFQFSLQLTKGVDVVEEGGNLPSSRANAVPNFFKFRTSGSVIYAPTEKASVIFRAEGQYSPDSLFGSEEISYGGVRFGRGYNSGELAGDSGYGLSLQPQYRFDALDVLPGWSVSPYTFLDYAEIFNTPGDSQRDASLFSSGGGFAISNGSWLSFSIELDKPLTRTPLSQDDKSPRYYGTIEIKL